MFRRLSAKDKLKEYRQKREFDKTPEPRGKVQKRSENNFVIHKHYAEKAGLHWDLRLEDQGVLKSWVLRKGLPKKGQRRLAIQVEDHPVSYKDFEGIIPEGYGKGRVEIDSKGKYDLIEKKADKWLFKLPGKYSGVYSLVRIDNNRWLLLKTTEKKSFLRRSQLMDLSKITNKTIVTHFGDDVDNFVSTNLLKEQLGWPIQRVAAGSYVAGALNVDTGNVDGIVQLEDGTIIIDHHGKSSDKCAADYVIEAFSVSDKISKRLAEWARIVDLSVVDMSKLSIASLSSYIIRLPNGWELAKQIFSEIDDCTKELTDEEIEKFGLQDIATRWKNRLKLFQAKEKDAIQVNDIKIFVTDSFIENGAMLAYTAGYDVYFIYTKHSSGKGYTYSITVNPDTVKEIPYVIVDKLRELEEHAGGDSNVWYFHPSKTMLIVGGMKSPEVYSKLEPSVVKEILTSGFVKKAYRRLCRFTRA